MRYSDPDRPARPCRKFHFPFLQPAVELPILRGYCSNCQICYSVYDVSGRQMTGPGMPQTFAEHTMHVAGFIRLNPEDSEPDARTGRERQ